jgi:hypothetical protein
MTKPTRQTAIFTPSDNPSHGKPGDNVPAQPGGTPWVPNSPPTGTPAPPGGPSTQKPPGWSAIFMTVLTAYLSNAHLSSQGVADDAIIDLAAALTDRLLARYPGQFPVAA